MSSNCSLRSRFARVRNALLGAVLILGSAAPDTISAQDHGAASCNAFRPTLTPLVRLASSAGVKVPGPERLERMLHATSSFVDAASFDPELMAERLDEEGGAEAIVDWVAHKVRFEAYRGLLRGSRGTLISTAGNSLDQSVLLAQMLRDAAYDARIVRGSLDEKSAARLVGTMFSARAVIPAGNDVDIAKLASTSGIRERELQAYRDRIAAFDLETQPAYRDALAARNLINSQLKAAGIQLGADVTAALIEETRDYAWVQFRTGASGAWRDAHPAFGAMPPPEVSVSATLADTVPPDLQHRLRIEFTLERKYGNRLQTEALMEPWERPVANLIGVPMTIGNTVLGVDPATTLEDLAGNMADHALFAPVFMGSLAPGAQAFDLLGNVVPPDAAASNAAAVVQTVTRRGAQAASALGGLGSTSTENTAQVALTAQWIDFVLIAPGGAETRHRRFVFDRLTPESRATGGMTLQDESVVLRGLLTSQVIMLNPGEVTPAYLAGEMRKTAVAASLALQRLRGVAEADSAQAARAVTDVDLKEHLLLFAAFDGAVLPAGTLSYRAEPSVLVLFNEFTPGESPRMATGVDIIHNARRVVRSQGERVFTDPSAAILAGTWETSAERQFIAARTGGEVQGVYSAFAVSDGTMRTLAPDTDATGAQLGAALPLIQADLARGFAVVLPGRAAGSTGPLAWWRVNPVTGETLGMGMNGRGTAATEESVKQIGIAGKIMTVTMGVASHLACMGHANLFCCLAQASLSTAAGVYIGIIVAAKTVNAALAVLFYVDIGGGAAGFLVPDFCS